MSNIMASHPKMTQGTTDRIAYKHFISKFKDCAADGGKGNALDAFGCLWAIMTALAFEAAYGAAPQPHVDPGAAGGNGIALAQWKHDKERLSIQNVAV